MPAERVSMRKIREVLRLTHALGMSRRLVGEATGIGKTAVGEYVRRAAVAGLSWPIPDEIDDAELERRLFPPTDASSSAARTEPDWSHIHAELKRRGVTLALLWQEYRAEHAHGYAYSWFCERYSDWRKRISPTMRQTHVAGEKLFVDWAGDTIPVFDPTTGEEHRAHIFVAALGASNYTYAEARWTETLPDWIGAHVNALAAIGGVPKALRARQSEGRHHQAVALRARHQPDLSGSRRPLRLRGAADARDEAARQGQGRGRGPDRRALRAGEAAQPTLLLARRVERRDPRLRRGDQRQGHAPRRQEPATSCWRRSTVRRSMRCRASPTAMPNGSGPASRPTITSRSPTITTRCRRS